MDLLKIGHKIHQMRLHKRLTLKKIGEATGFTKSYLSMIERGKKSPPIATLSKIAAALDTDIATFFNQRRIEDQITLVRREERQIVVRDGTAIGYQYESIAPSKRGKKMEPFIITHPPNLKKETMVDHEGEELVYVLEGKINVFYGDKKYFLRKGDSAYFDSTIPHRSEGVGSKSAKALVVISLP